MKKVFHPAAIIFTVSIILLLSSCTTPEALYVHVPDKVNSPGFKEKGDIKLDFSVQPQRKDTIGSSVSYSCDFAYAPINHLGIIASWRSVNRLGINYEHLDYPERQEERFMLNGSQYDLGIGYFNKINERHRFEIYAGYGRGYIENDAGNYSYPGNYHADYHRIFQQADYGIGTKHFLFMLGERLLFEKFENFEYSPNDSHIDSFPVNEILNKTFVFLQPYFEIQTGYKYARVNFQVGYQFQTGGPLAKDIYNNRYYYYPSSAYISIGIMLNYAQRFGKSKLKPADNVF